MNSKPLTREELRELAKRSRDPDVRILLQEVKRLRGVVLEAYKCYCGMVRYTEDPNEGAPYEAFSTLMEDEPVIEESMPRRRESQDQKPRYPHMSEQQEAELRSRKQR